MTRTDVFGRRFVPEAQVTKGLIDKHLERASFSLKYHANGSLFPSSEVQLLRTLSTLSSPLDLGIWAGNDTSLWPLAYIFVHFSLGNHSLSEHSCVTGLSGDNA